MCCALRSLGEVVGRAGFEPAKSRRTTVLQTGAIDRSATYPFLKRFYYRKKIAILQYLYRIFDAIHLFWRDGRKEKVLVLSNLLLF